MGIFDGIGRALGAGALGYGQGELKGEQEAWRRLQQQQVLGLKARTATRPGKEEDPLPLKALFDARERVLSSNDPNAWKNWIATGQEDLFNQVARGYSEGYTQGGASGGRALGMGVYGIANRPVGDDPGDAISQLAGAGTSQRRFIGQPPAPQRDLSYVRPALKPNAPATSALETAQTRNTNATATETETMLPWKVAEARDSLLNADFLRNRAMRQDNLKVAFDQYDAWMQQFKALTEANRLNFSEQAEIFKALLSYEGQLLASGQRAGSDLTPFLKSRSLTGELLNSDASRLYLQQKGYSPEQIQTIIGGFPRQTGGAPAGGDAQPAGYQGQPAPAGGWPEQGSTPHLAGAQQWAQTQGWRVTSAIGAGDKHNPGSQHYHGNAFDLGTKGKSEEQVRQLVSALQAQGLTVIDERVRPKGQKVWTGPHLHVEGPRTQTAGARQGEAPPLLPPVGPGSPTGAGSATPSANPGATAASTPSSTGINLTQQPGPNPYHPETEWFEHNVIRMLTAGGKSANQIVMDLQNMGKPDDAARAQKAIQGYQQQTNAGGQFQGIASVPGSGERIPQPPSIGGQQFGPAEFAYYSNGPAPMTMGANGQPMPAAPPSVPTRPYAYGGYAPQPEVVMEPAPPPAAPPPVQPAMTAPAETFPTSPFTPPPAGGPPVYGMPAGPGMQPGPSIYGFPKGDAGGPPLTSTPSAERGPRVGAPNEALDAQSAAFQNKVMQTASSDPGRAKKNVQAEIARYKKHELAPAINKFLGKYKLTKPETVRQVFQQGLEYGKEVASLPKSERNKKLFKILEQRLKPALPAS